MEEYNRNEKINFFNQRKVESSKAWLLFLLLGWSYGSLGSMGKQIFFYLTIGGLGLWGFYVLFTLNSKVKKHNKEIAKQIGLSHSDIEMLGLN